MKITIDITPTELAEFIFALVDCDVEIDDDADDNDDADEKDEKDNAITHKFEYIFKPKKTTS